MNVKYKGDLISRVGFMASLLASLRPPMFASRLNNLFQIHTSLLAARFLIYTEKNGKSLVKRTHKGT